MTPYLRPERAQAGDRPIVSPDPEEVIMRTFTLFWHEQTLRGEIRTYNHPPNPAIELYDEDNLPYARPSVNPVFLLPQGIIAIKNYSENAGVLEALVTAGVIEPTDDTIPLGFADAHLCRLLV
jgi:hypothetical protein